MSGELLDSSAILYTFDDRDQDKKEAAKRLVTNSLRTRVGVISRQVVQEDLNVATTKLTRAASHEAAIALLADVLEPLWQIYPTAATYGRALDIKTRYGYGYYDSLILAAALSRDCHVLWTEDMQNGQTIEGLAIRNPF